MRITLKKQIVKNLIEIARIKKLLKVSEYKPISDFTRKAIDEKIRIVKVNNQNESIEVPDWIPDGKYYALVKNAIFGVNDSPSALVKDLISKFPYEYIIIKRKNKQIPKLEYSFSISTENLRC